MLSEVRSARTLGEWKCELLPLSAFTRQHTEMRPEPWQRQTLYNKVL